MPRKHLFTTVKEIQNHYPFQDTFEFKDLLSTLKLVERLYILPDIDITTWATLLTKIDDAAAAEGVFPIQQWADLADRVGFAVAHLTALEHMDKSNVIYSAAGLLVAKTEGAVPASEQRAHALKFTLLRQSQIGLDQVLEHLEANLAIFTDWATSSQRGDISKLIIRSAAEFSKSYSINDNRWIFRRLMPVQEKIIDNQVKGKLGAEFVEAYIANLHTGTLSADNKLIQKRLNRAIAYTTMAEAAGILQMVFGPNGIAIFDSFHQPEGSRRQADDISRIQLLRDIASDSGREEFRQLQIFLDTNASATRYPEYFNSENYSPPDIDVTEINEDDQQDFHAL